MANIHLKMIHQSQGQFLSCGSQDCLIGGCGLIKMHAWCIYRGLVLSQLIAFLATTPLRKANVGYLKVQSHRRKEMEIFIQRAVVNKHVGCAIFNPKIGNELLTKTQIAEISDYIASVSRSFKDTVQSFRERLDCRK